MSGRCVSGRRRSMRGVRGGPGLRRRFFRLREGDVDDVVLLLAEGVNINLADQRDFHRGGFAVDLLIDRDDVRWRGELGVGQIEGERGVEQQRELLLVQHRRGVDAVGHFKHKADEGRLHRGADANRRTLQCRGRGALLA